jgi:phage replication O-like protein O
MPEPSPQLEDGYTRIANEFLEALARADYPASTLRFLLIVMRETWGWQKKQAKIPTSLFAEAFGVTERRVRQIRDDCLRHNLIEVESGDQFDTPIYRIQKRYTDWMVWKTNNPWEYKPTRKTTMPGFPEDEHTERPEGEPSTTINGKDSLKERERKEAPLPPPPNAHIALIEQCEEAIAPMCRHNLVGNAERTIIENALKLPGAESVILQECMTLAARHLEGENVHLSYLINNVNDAVRKLKKDKEKEQQGESSPRSSYEAALAEVEALADAKFADLPEPASTVSEGGARDE